MSHARSSLYSSLEPAEFAEEDLAPHGWRIWSMRRSPDPALPLVSGGIVKRNLRCHVTWRIHGRSVVRNRFAIVCKDDLSASWSWYSLRSGRKVRLSPHAPLPPAKPKGRSGREACLLVFFSRFTPYGSRFTVSETLHALRLTFHEQPVERAGAR